MASVLERIDVNEVEQLPSWYLKGKDATVDTWPLMASPVAVLLLLTAYLIVVVVGPKLMKNKPAFNLDRILLFYNAFQVLAAAFLVYKVIEMDIFKNGFLLGGCDYPIYKNEPSILIGSYVYFISKISELLDTVFFVLRKKNNQISFLHVFHHTSMVLYMWWNVKYASAGDGVVLLFLNCCVHVVMYSYYLLAGLGPKFQKYLWWKKYVTEMQLIQFLLMLTYLTYTHYSPKCTFLPMNTRIIFFNISVYLVLFLRFYYNSYRSKKNKVN